MAKRADRRRRPGDRHLSKADRHKTPGDRHFRPSARGRFVAIDGEGWEKTYALLADSEGNSLVRPAGISSREAFDWLSYLPERCGKAVYVGFALGYDINHWLKDLSTPALYALWRRGQVRWEDWWLQWAPGRWFHVKHIPSGRSVRIYDVFPFFQSSFIKACGEWGITVPPGVTAGKAGRRNFSRADLPAIEAYNAVELRTLVELVGKLKDGLYAAGIKLNQWYGAGAAATYLLSTRGAKAVITKTPPEVADAALYAYFGGRIEAGRTGHVPGPITNWDVRSAYPDATRGLPNLTKGRWVPVAGFDGAPTVWAAPFAVYHIEWQFPAGWPYYPLPWRSPEEAIYFPRVGRGWYWAAEAEAAALTAQTFGGTVRVLAGFKFVPDAPGERPFAWVADLFAERKRVGSKTGAGKALKLGLNALYGKLAQRTGVFQREPTFRQYEYAGWITSFVRAKLWMLSWGRWDSVVSFATDGIYSTAPTGPTAEREDLGAWEITRYGEMDVAMPGVYRIRKDGGDWELFGRGYGKTGVPWQEVTAGWKKGKDRRNCSRS